MKETYKAHNKLKGTIVFTIIKNDWPILCLDLSYNKIVLQ